MNSGRFKRVDVNCFEIKKLKIVLSDKLCDNNYDCPGGEDEGELHACIAFGTNTANGCCQSYFYRGEEFALAGQWQGYDYYQSTVDSSKFLIYYESRNVWYLDTTDGMMNWSGWSFQEQVTPTTSDGKEKLISNIGNNS